VLAILVAPQGEKSLSQKWNVLRAMFVARNEKCLYQHVPLNRSSEALKWTQFGSK